jgi:hypothetical protein
VRNNETDRVAAAAQAVGAARLAAATGDAPSTVGAVLRRCRISRLPRLDRTERAVIRYEHPAPGDLLHADVTKLGNIPAGGGWRFLGRQQGGAEPPGLGAYCLCASA